jgi:hypothetical protein
MTIERRGRKKLPPHRLRNCTSLIRFNDDEFQDVADAADQAEELLAIWIRRVVVAFARKKLKQGQEG